LPADFAETPIVQSYNPSMSIEQLETAIANLPPDEFARLASWFAEFEAKPWDRQIEEDERAGRLDHVIQRVRDDIASGRSKPL
jgi:hypothetical protein